MKKLNLLGCGLFTAGLVIAFIAFATMNFDITVLTTNPPYEEKSFASSAPVSSFTLDEHSANIQLGVSPDDRVHVRYFENEKEEYQITDGPDLRFEKINHYQWYDYIMVFNFWSPTVEILLPENHPGDVTINNKNGGISVQTLSGDNLSLITGNGDVHADSIRAKGKIDAHSSNGQLQLTQISAGGPATLSSKNGAVTLEDVGAQAVSAESRNGHVSLTRVTAQTECIAKSSNGGIALEALSAGKSISLTSGNGALYGSIVGKIVDFTIEAKSGNGDSNLPKSLAGGTKQLTAKSGNGDIDITFTQD